MLRNVVRRSSASCAESPLAWVGGVAIREVGSEPPDVDLYFKFPAVVKRSNFVDIGFRAKYVGVIEPFAFGLKSHGAEEQTGFIDSLGGFGFLEHLFVDSAVSPDFFFRRVMEKTAVGIKHLAFRPTTTPGPGPTGRFIHVPASARPEAQVPRRIFIKIRSPEPTFVSIFCFWAPATRGARCLEGIAV